MRALASLLAIWLALSPALADSAYVAPTATGQAATGQIPGTATNDNATAGNVGEYITSGNCPNTTSAVTITIATPGVVTWTAHGFVNDAITKPSCPVVFTNSGGALPTGITAGTTYWIVPSSVTANTFQIATSIANAIAGTSVNTSGTQSGTQTGTAGVALANNTTADITGISLTVGDWRCWGLVGLSPAGSTTITNIIGWVNSVAVTPASPTMALRATMTTGSGQFFPVLQTRYLNSSTTTIFLGINASFGVSTAVGTGQISCQRAR